MDMGVCVASLFVVVVGSGFRFGQDIGHACGKLGFPVATIWVTEAVGP
jgi:hypothetical protein